MSWHVRARYVLLNQVEAAADFHAVYDDSFVDAAQAGTNPGAPHWPMLPRVANDDAVTSGTQKQVLEWLDMAF